MLNIELFLSSCGLIFVNKIISCIFFEQRKLNSYKTGIKAFRLNSDIYT